MIPGPTKLQDIMDLEYLQIMVDQGFVRVKRHPTLPLYIWNYSEKAMFEKEWNAVTLNCRGLITDIDTNIVARPWQKFFNYGEKATLIGSHDPVEITDKMDGSLGIGYPTPDGWAVATRGSFESDQAKWATEWLQQRPGWIQAPAGWTPLWEIIYPENRIVLDYGKLEGLVLLGAVDIQYGHVYGPNEAAGLFDWRGERTTVFPMRTLEAFMSSEFANRSNAEGVVVRSGWRMVKVKQEDYLVLHKLITGLSQRSVWEALGQGKTLEEVCAPLPDEFHDWVRGVHDTLVTQLLDLEEKVYLEYDRIGNILLHAGGSGDRAAFAKIACKSPNRSWLFLLYDGKHEALKSSMWQSLKPSADSRWGNSGD